MPTVLADAVGAAANPLCEGLPGKLNPICQLGDLTADTAGALAGGVVREIAQAVVGATAEVLGSVLEFLTAPVRPDFSQDWYTDGVDKMIVVAGLFATVFFLAGLMQAVVQHSSAELGRVVGYTVGAFAVSGIVLYLAQGFVALVDVASAEIAAGTPKNMAETLTGLVVPLSALSTGTGGQGFLAMLLGLFTLLAALAIYIELFIRNVMIHIVVYFLPLMLVATIWSSTRHWAKRGIEFLAVLIFSKFVLYAVIGLGWSAVASFDDQRLTSAWASVLTGLSLLSVAAFMPYLLFKLLPFMEIHVGRALTRQDAGRMATAPMSPLTSSMRTVDMNLGRASRIAAVFSGAGAVGAAAASAGGSAVPIAGGTPRALPAAAPTPAATGWVPSRPGGGDAVPRDDASSLPKTSRASGQSTQQGTDEGRRS